MESKLNKLRCRAGASHTLPKGVAHRAGAQALRPGFAGRRRRDRLPVATAIAG